MKLRIRNDLILIICLLIIAGAMIPVTLLLTDTGKNVRITVDGELYGMYPRDKDAKISIGGTNVLVIEDNRVYMENACCENNTCVKQGSISNVGQTIICLPNRVTVTVTD